MRPQIFLISILFAALTAGTAIAQTPATSAPVIVSGGDGELPPPGAKAGMVTMRVEDIDAEPVLERAKPTLQRADHGGGYP